MLLCLNAPELNTAFLQDQMAEIAPELQFVERVANPAVFADVDEAQPEGAGIPRAPKHCSRRVSIKYPSSAYAASAGSYQNHETL